ncbi:hypothetical protein [Falsirhodobacter sp. 1013]|uniref:hypothetical protein n=1 Tax=Falsirhodobacter sp. 1013 TaxID=3417566 RepID=UPI003EB79419
MSRLLILTALVGGSAGFLVLGPNFSEDHSLKEQIALGLVAILMICTLFGMKIGTILGLVFRIIVVALIWRFLASLLRVVRMR